MTSSGNTFEKAAIVEHLEKYDTDPVTGEVLEYKVLIPNHAMRRTVEQFRAAQKSASLQSSSMFGGRGEFSAYAMDSISMRQERTSSEADGRSQVSSASSGGAAASSAAAAEELEAMKEKLGMFMLGGDMSGGQAGTHAALTLSNAITNLSVGCWGAVEMLEPVPSANMDKWRQQITWYTAPLSQIIVKETAIKKLADGDEVANPNSDPILPLPLSYPYPYPYPYPSPSP